MDNENEAGNKVVQLEKKGWSQASIARALHVTKDAVGKWKRGERHPRALVLDALDRLLTVNSIPPKKLYAKGSRNRGQ